MVLVGIPGSGKSAVAAHLAESLRRPLVDTDLACVEILGASLPELFATEQGRKEVQQQTQRLAVAAIAEGAVTALGSVAVLDPVVRTALIPESTWWLDTSVTTATRRLGLASLGMETLIVVRKQLEAELATRTQWYEEIAGHRVQTDRLSIAEVAQAIIATQEDA